MSRIRVVFQPDPDYNPVPSEETPCAAMHVGRDEPIPTEAVCEHGRAVYDCDACLAALTEPEPAPESGAAAWREQRRDSNGTLLCQCGKPGRYFSHREGTDYEAMCDKCFERLLPSEKAIQSGRLEELLAKYSFPAEFAEDAE